MMERNRFGDHPVSRRVVLRGGLAGTFGVAALPLLAACSGSSSSPPATTASSGTATSAPAATSTQAPAVKATTAAQPANLQFWYAWSPSDQPLKYYQKLANETWLPKHPGSSFKIVNVPDSQQEAKFTAAFAAGQGPDLFTDMVDIYTQRGITAQLPDDLAKTLQEGLIPASILNYTYQGKWYAVPFIPIGSLGLVMFYNADQFKEVGLDPEKPPTTMTELQTDAKKLVKLDAQGNVTRSGFAHNIQPDPGAMAGKFYPFLHAYGGRLYDPQTVVAKGFVNSPGGVEALQVLKDMCIGPNKVSSTTLGLTEEQMVRGQASMIFRESSFVGYFHSRAPKLNFQVSQVPKEKEEGCGAFGLNWSLMVNKASSATADAFDFLRDMATPQVDLAVAKAAGTIPAWKASWKDPYMSSRPDYQALQYTSTHDPGIRYLAPNSTQAAQAYGKLLLAVMQGQLEPQAAADEAATQIDHILKP